MVVARENWLSPRLAWAGALGALGFLLTFDAWRDIAHIAWRDEESSQILLAPIVIGWLAWVRRRRLRHCRPAIGWTGPILVLIGWAMYSTGDTYLIQCFWHGGAVLVVVGCCLTLLGGALLRNFIPVFMALVFLVPVPGRVRQQVAIPLQSATASVTQRALELGGVDVQRSGNLLSINNREVTIAEACNGLRMMFALMTVSFALAFGTPLRPFVRFLLLAASPVSAILCNVIRLVPTIWLYGTHPSMADAFHAAAGWCMLLVAFLLLTGIISLLRWALVPVSPYTLAYD